MNRFGYTRAGSVAEALQAFAAHPRARFIAGGTNLVDLMKYDVEAPDHLVDITRLPLDRVEEGADGALRVGALVGNADLAHHPLVRERFPLLASALLAGASPQLRNMATTGGNLLQRTRCHYFYDAATPCNKREPGTGCPAIQGVNRNHAILGASDRCIATHPSDLCVALAALDATVLVSGPGGDRRIAFADFHRLPEDKPEADTTLAPGELITAVEIPACGFGPHHTYLKLRDRHSYAFALVSVAAGLVLDGGRIVRARLALGGVAHKPWRDPAAEALLDGRAATDESFRAAADRLLADAVPRSGNAFKIPLARRAIVRALRQAAAGTPQSQTDKRIQ